ncbi:MAG: membrane protein insertase YidC [Alphaproteobacteria bacterium]|nr:membrane protein insertase YidC [Alphaproteobacteria bacterium]
MIHDKDKMHPEDKRNLIIFAIISVTLFFLYEMYVIKPQADAMKKAREARAEILLNNPALLEPLNNIPREEALAQSARLFFENKELSGSIALKGGLIDDLVLKKYFETVEKKKNVVLLKPQETEDARFMKYGWVTAADSGVSVPDASTIWDITGNTALSPDKPVTLFWTNPQGIRFERVISLDEEYVFTIKQRVINNSDQTLVLYPYALISQKSIPEGHFRTWISHEGPMGFIGSSLEQMYYAAMREEPNKTIDASRGWIGISDKYWLTALLPSQDVNSKFRFIYTPDPVTEERNLYQTDFTGAPMQVDASTTIEYEHHFYAGAKKVLTLEKYQTKLGIDNLDLAVDFGWFWFLTYPLFLGLHYIGLWLGNIGVAIVILTIILRGAAFPLTQSSYRSFAKMKVVAPQVNEIREKYRNDKEQLQKAIVELYQREGVNPMAGCFPMLLQIPIFFAFYKVLFSTIEIRHAPFFGWIQDLSAPDPTSVFNLFGVINWNPPSFLMIGAWPCMMLVAMMIQKKLNPPPQDKIQRDMMNIFPFMLTFIMAGFASGLVIYWTFSAILSVFQQAFIMRSMGVPIYIFEKDKYEEELNKKLDSGSPGVHPLAEMAEDEIEDAMFGDDAELLKDIKPPKPKKKKKKK